MRNTTPTQAIEMLLRALYEGAASNHPWVGHALLSGRFYRLPDGTLLPAGMRFGVEGLAWYQWIVSLQ